MQWSFNVNTLPLDFTFGIPASFDDCLSFARQLLQAGKPYQKNAWAEVVATPDSVLSFKNGDLKLDGEIVRKVHFDADGGTSITDAKEWVFRRRDKPLGDMHYFNRVLENQSSIAAKNLSMTYIAVIVVHLRPRFFLLIAARVSRVPEDQKSDTGLRYKNQCSPDRMKEHIDSALAHNLKSHRFDYHIAPYAR